MLTDRTDFWRPVALSQDLPAGTVMPARIAAGSIALWRSQSDHVAASADRCPHRGMRLSHGFVRGEALSCIYHGWSYSQAGSCLRIPAHPGLAPPETIRVVTYVVQEANGILWVAEGAPAGAPPVIDGFVPLRSMTSAAGLAAIEAASGAKEADAGMSCRLPGAPELRLLTVGQDNGETLIHVLVPDGSSTADRIAASRAVEGLRRKAEQIEAEGIAS